MKKIFFLASFLTLFLTVSAQENCDVMLETIKGTYKGDCKSNKADGSGTSTGTDSYTGTFKKGLPDGEGTYTWKNGDIYAGTWIKGKRNGQGTLTKKAEGKPEVKQTGFWKDDTYVGEYEKPFKILSRTPKITMFQIVPGKPQNTNSIEISMESVASASTTRMMLRELKTIKGSFVGEIQSLTVNPRGSSYRVNQVVFPIRLKIITTTGQEAEFEIYQAGRWMINMGVNE